MQEEDFSEPSSKDDQEISQSETDYDMLKKQLTPIAQNISQRAVMFLNQLFLNLIREDNIQESPFDWIYEIKDPAVSPICSKIISRKYKSIAFRCYDCRQSSNSCVCQECFTKGDHKGHNYEQYQAQGGCCDCGNQQAWNPKSFCSDHKKGSELKLEIEPSTKKQFIEEYTLAFYVFFALNQLDINQQIKQTYGAMLVSSLHKHVDKNYQMKILGYELLQVTFSNQYPPLRYNQPLTILQRVFRNLHIYNLQEFPQLLFQIFPVEQSRIQIIKEYFQMTADIQLNSQHPLTHINFQYMTCAKIISKLIQNKQMKPLYLNKSKCPANIQNLAFVFCQYYWDLDYINNMKSARQYHILHLSMINVSQMAFYRQYGRLSCKQDVDNLNLDEVYLKVLGHMVRDVIHEKQILLKCIKQLFCFFKHEDVNKFSQAQQRAFAMFTIAYFEGDITQLFQPQVRNRFIVSLQISKQTFAELLKHLIKTSLKSYAMYGITPTFRSQKYIDYFLRKYSQNNFNLFLDLIYQKILMIISIDHLTYDDVVYEILMELIKLNKEKTNQAISSFPQDQQSEIKKLYQYQLNIMGSKVIKDIVNFLNTLTLVNLDEIVVSNYLKINQKQKIYDFYSRLLQSFKQLSIKQFKSLAISIINNEQIFEQFINDRIMISRGKLINKIPSKPLQTYIYSYIFQNYNKSILQTEVCLLSQVENRGKYSAIHIFNIDTILQLRLICRNVFEQFSFISENFKDISNKLFIQLVMELFIIYFYNRDKSLKQYFQSLMSQNMKKLISEDLIRQIVMLEKEKSQFQTQVQNIRNEKDMSDKKKRQKMLSIRQQKSEMIRKRQQTFLMGLQNSKESQNQPLVSNCIICKEAKQQELNLISYVNFTGLIERGILKNNVHPKNHLFFTTCGHKIHQSCFTSVSAYQPPKFCFLCKRETNILFPELSLLNNISQIQKQIKIQEFLNMIVPVLMSPVFNFDLTKQNAKTYFDRVLQISTQQSTFIYLLYAFVRELVYIGLQNFKYFQKSSFRLYYQIFHMIECRPKPKLQQSFLKINKCYNQNQIFLDNKLNSLEGYIMALLETSFLMKNNENSHKYIEKLSQLQIQQANKIVGLFKNQKSEITDLNMISPTNLFITIPEHLNELHEKMGQCPLCPNVTNQIYTCLLCGWSACFKCKKMLFVHSNTDHVGGSISIACFYGGIKFFFGENIFEDDSIYQNYLGTPYNQVQSDNKLSQPQKFKLNHQKLEDIYKVALINGIHQKVFGNK